MSAPRAGTNTEAQAVTDKHSVDSHLEGPDGQVRRGISRGRPSALLLGVGVVLLLVTEAVQLLWIQLYAVGTSWVEADTGEPSTGLDLVPAVLAGGLLLLLIGFVACMAGSPRGTLVGALCGLAITAIGITVAAAAIGITMAATASVPDIGSGIGLGLMLALPGLLLLAYAGAMRRYGGSVKHEVGASANGPSAT